MRHIKFFLSLILLSVLTSCGGGGSSGTTTPTLPADAVVITSANADTVANSAVASFETTEFLLGVEANTPATRVAIKTLTDYVFNKDRRSYSIATGVTLTEDCPVSGTVTDNYTETATSETGSFSFNQCDLGGVKFNGGFSYASTWNVTTGAYTDTGNGSLTVTFGSDSFTMAMDYSESGNDFSGEYSITVTYSISGSGFGGFLVETTQPLQGIYPGDVTSGQVIVTGANNTRLRITITSASTADVELDNGDGTFVFHSQIFI